MSSNENADPAQIGMRIRGANGQTADLLAVEQFDGTDVFKVTKDGAIFAKGLGVPADYVVLLDGATYKAFNSRTGALLTSSATYATVYAAALAALTDGTGVLIDMTDARGPIANRYLLGKSVNFWEPHSSDVVVSQSGGKYVAGNPTERRHISSNDNQKTVIQAAIDTPHQKNIWEVNSAIPIQSSDVDSSGNIYAGDASYGVWKSTDGGLTFTRIYTIPWRSTHATQNGRVWLTFVDSNNYVYVSAGSTNYLYRSIDGGTNFSMVLDLARTYGIDGMIISMTEDGSGNLYAAEYGLELPIQCRIFKSTDDGATWVENYSRNARHWHSIRYNSSNGWLYAMTGESTTGTTEHDQLYRSKNEGVSWTCIVPNTVSNNKTLPLGFVGSLILMGRDDSTAAAYSHIRSFTDDGVSEPFTPSVAWTNPYPDNIIMSFVELEGYVYASTASETVGGAITQIIRTVDGVTWETVWTGSTNVGWCEKWMHQLTTHPRSNLIVGTHEHGNNFCLADESRSTDSRASIVHLDGVPFPAHVDWVTINPATTVVEELSGGVTRYRNGEPNFMDPDTLDDGLVLYLPMEAINGGRVIDCSQMRKHGTNSGAVIATGKCGNGLDFDGSDDYLGFGDILDLGTSDRSISVWFKTTDTDFNIISKSRAATGTNRWYVLYEGGMWKASIIGTAATIETTYTSATYNNGYWHHLAVIWDRAGMAQIWLDGVPKAWNSQLSRLSAEDIQNSYYVFVGHYNDSVTGQTVGTSTLKYDGMLDELRVYDRVLTPREIRALYRQTAPVQWARDINVSELARRTNILSGTFAIDSTGVKTVTTAHGLTEIPAVEDIDLTVIENTNVDDWAHGYVKIESVDATNVVCKVNVTTASATGSATAKLGIKINGR